MNIRDDLYKTIKEGLPIILPNKNQQERSGEQYVLVTDLASDRVKELAGDSREAFIINQEPLQISFPNSEEVINVEPEEIIIETASKKGGGPKDTDETPYEKFFASAMKKFGVSSPNELSPDETKKFFNYVDKNWEAEEETDEDEVDEVMEATTKKKGGRPRGAAHIENVRFWDMSEIQLRYIIKDAGEAVHANPTGHKAGKYSDEIADAVTVLYWRKKKGIKENIDTESIVQTKIVSGRKIQIKKVGSGPAHKVYVEEDPAMEFPSADAAKSWLIDYESAGGHFTYESKKVRSYVKGYLKYINS